MKIVFWSPVPGQAGTSANMAAIMIMVILKHLKKIVAMQSQFEFNNLRYSLLGKDEDEMSKEFFQDTGIDSVVRYLKAGSVDKETLENCSISLMHQQLNLITESTKISQKLYEGDTKPCLERLMDIVGRYYDMAFIDTKAGKNDLTDIVLSKADLIVINLNQNPNVIDYYLQIKKNMKLDDSKIIYIIGKYNDDSRYTIKNLKKMYKGMAGPYFTIPYSISFANALHSGELIKYIFRNKEARKNHIDYSFVKDIIAIADEISERQAKFEADQE